VTRFLLRTDRDQLDDGSSEMLLDWFEGDKARSTVAYAPDFLRGLTPSAIAYDLFRLGGAVYCIDKLAERATSPDGWTRELELVLPVADLDRWSRVSSSLHEALDYLTGDRWNVEFVPLPSPQPVQQVAPLGQVVSLFSGGLDSLAGVVELLESGSQVVLVGHHDSPFTDSRQIALNKVLVDKYGPERVIFRQVYLRPAFPRKTQERPLPSESHENTTRSRSLLFIAAGVAVADALGAGIPLYMPENGFIGVNVPLTAARVGSLSTRTTHPYFIGRVQAVLEALELDHPIENQFRLLTKGEVVKRSPNFDLLASLASQSISCSHPELARLRHRPVGNCGYCYPCLIRRAALHHVDLDMEHYAWDAPTDESLLHPSSDSGRALRSVLMSLAQSPRHVDVLRNGRIPNSEAGSFFAVYCRGREELRSWLVDRGGPMVRSRLGLT